MSGRSLWYDEAVEFWTAQAPLTAIAAPVLHSFQPPLYPILLHFWSHVGQSSLWLRSLSLVVNLVGMLGMILWAKRQSGATAAWVVGSLMAISTPEIRYAVDAGEYALMECLLVWSLFFISETFKANSWRSWIAWGILGTAAVFSQYGAMLVVIPVGLVTLVENFIRGDRARLLRQAVVGASGLLAGIFLYFAFFSRQAPFDVKLPAAFSLLNECKQVVLSLAETLQYPLTAWPFAILPVWVGAMAVALLGAGVVVIFASRLKTLRPKTRHPSRLAAADSDATGSMIGSSPPSAENTQPGSVFCIASPILRIVVWLGFAFLSYYVPVRLGLYGNGTWGFRYALIFSPLFFSLTGAVIAHFEKGGWAPISRMVWLFFFFVSLISLSGFSIHAINRSSQWPEPSQMSQAVQFWNANRTPDDITYVSSEASPGFRYYARIFSAEEWSPLSPTWIWDCQANDQAPGCRQGGVIYGAWLRGTRPEEKTRLILASLPGQVQRFWLVAVAQNPVDVNTIFQADASGYRVTAQGSFTNAMVYLLERK